MSQLKRVYDIKDNLPEIVQKNKENIIDFDTKLENLDNKIKGLETLKNYPSLNDFLAQAKDGDTGTYENNGHPVYILKYAGNVYEFLSKNDMQLYFNQIETNKQEIEKLKDNSKVLVENTDFNNIGELIAKAKDNTFVSIKFLDGSYIYGIVKSHTVNTINIVGEYLGDDGVLTFGDMELFVNANSRFDLRNGIEFITLNTLQNDYYDKQFIDGNFKRVTTNFEPSITQQQGYLIIDETGIKDLAIGVDIRLDLSFIRGLVGTVDTTPKDGDRLIIGVNGEIWQGGIQNYIEYRNKTNPTDINIFDNYNDNYFIIRKISNTRYDFIKLEKKSVKWEPINLAVYWPKAGDEINVVDTNGEFEFVTIPVIRVSDAEWHFDHILSYNSNEYIRALWNSGKTNVGTIDTITTTNTGTTFNEDAETIKLFRKVV